MDVVILCETTNKKLGIRFEEVYARNRDSRESVYLLASDLEKHVSKMLSTSDTRRIVIAAAQTRFFPRLGEKYSPSIENQGAASNRRAKDRRRRECAVSCASFSVRDNVVGLWQPVKASARLSSHRKAVEKSSKTLVKAIVQSC